MTHAEVLVPLREFAVANPFGASLTQIQNALAKCAARMTTATPAENAAIRVEAAEILRPIVSAAPEAVDDLVREALAARAATMGGDLLPDGVHPLTDLANAHRLLREHGADLRYCADLGGWHAWSGTVWRRDEGEAMRRQMDVGVRLLRYGGQLLSSAQSKEAQEQAESLIAWAKRSQAEAQIRHALELAKHFLPIAVTADAWDTDPWSLTCANGTIDLRTGELREACREDLITRLAPVDFDVTSKAPQWNVFLGRVLPDADVRSFAQRAVGYSLTASTAEQVLMICHGSGANGKSTYLETLREVLGEYAAHAQTDSLMRVGARGADNDIARLRGARYVTAIESGEGRRLDEERIKQLTGSDTIAARFLYREAFEFRPVMKIWIACNSRPEVRGTDEGIWRRLRLIPWSVTIPPDERDGDLAEKLRAEAPGILAWAVRGCVMWQRDGLRAPEAVMLASREWRDDSDVIGEFVEERCHVADYAKAKATPLYEAFRSWAEEQGIESGTQKAFGAQLKRLGFAQERTKTARMWVGIGLLQTEGDG